MCLPLQQSGPSTLWMFWVLNLISRGCKLGFQFLPPSLFMLSDIPCSIGRSPSGSDLGDVPFPTFSSLRTKWWVMVSVFGAKEVLFPTCLKGKVPACCNGEEF